MASTQRSWPARWVAGLFASLALPLFAATLDLRWRDPAREREVPLRVYLPVQQGADTRCPLLLLSADEHPAEVLPSAGVGAWIERWVGAGLAVVHIRHPGVTLGSAPFRTATGSARGVTPEQLLGQVDDVAFVIAELRRRQGEGVEPWLGCLDLERVGFAGMGLGARLAQALAGERYPGPIASLARADLRAFVAVNPAVQGQRKTHPDRYGAMHAPFFAVVERRVPTTASQPTFGRRLALFDALPPGGKLRVVVPDVATAPELVYRLSALFLLRHLRAPVVSPETGDATYTQTIAKLRAAGVRVDAK